LTKTADITPWWWLASHSATCTVKIRQQKAAKSANLKQDHCSIQQFKALEALPSHADPSSRTTALAGEPQYTSHWPERQIYHPDAPATEPTNDPNCCKLEHAELANN
jgi:hypothetical protein